MIGCDDFGRQKGIGGLQVNEALCFATADMPDTADTADALDVIRKLNWLELLN